MKKFCVIVLLSVLSVTSFAQSRAVQRLFDLYNNREFEKCVQRADKLLARNENELEAYYIKALAYFEMAQLPQRYEEFTRDPLMDCLRALSILRSKDRDGEIFDEYAEQLAIIYQYTEYVADQIKESNQTRAIQLHQRLMRAFRVQTSALDVAIIYAKVGNYEQCMRQVSRLYERAPADVSPSHDYYDGLTQGALLLADNWMFRDLFWLVETYKPKFETSYAISKGFRDAILLSIDTARNEEDKDLLFDFSRRGLAMYHDDKAFAQHVENRWLEIIRTEVAKFDASEGTQRTWRDTIPLRNTFQYIRLAEIVLPNSTEISQLRRSLESKYHIKPYRHEESLLRKYALEAINMWRERGCQCDTGRVVRMRPVFAVDWDTTLARIAQSHAENMFANNFTDHIDPNTGETPLDRVNATHLQGQMIETFSKTIYIRATRIAEVLGHGYALGEISDTEELEELIHAVVRSWMETRFSQNCPKIMTKEHTHMGIGVYGDKWVLLLANIHDIIISRK